MTCVVLQKPSQEVVCANQDPLLCLVTWYTAGCSTSTSGTLGFPSSPDWSVPAYSSFYSFFSLISFCPVTVFSPTYTHRQTRKHTQTDAHRHAHTHTHIHYWEHLFCTNGAVCEWTKVVEDLNKSENPSYFDEPLLRVIVG